MREDEIHVFANEIRAFEDKDRRALHLDWLRCLPIGLAVSHEHTRRDGFNETGFGSDKTFAATPLSTLPDILIDALPSQVLIVWLGCSSSGQFNVAVTQGTSPGDAWVVGLTGICETQLGTFINGAIASGRSCRLRLIHPPRCGKKNANKL